MKQKKGFTLVELSAVMVIISILAIIVTPLVVSVINDAKASANMRNVDAYGKALETAAMAYLMDNGKYPSDLLTLKTEYTGKEVKCNTMLINSDGSLLLSECSVDGKEVKDDTTKDGWYRYGGYASYKIGNKITFAGSDWYVIEDSGKDQEYVTLLKDKILTHEQLGEYGYVFQSTCDDWWVENGWYGCTTVDQVVTIRNDGMLYYWSDTCHDRGDYGYAEYDDSGCDDHYDYKGSKIKETLENVYMPKIGEENLVSVDGSKIRLLTLSEIQNNFGYGHIQNDDYMGIGSEPDEMTPEWLYTNFGENSDDIDFAIRDYYIINNVDDGYDEFFSITIQPPCGGDGSWSSCYKVGSAFDSGNSSKGVRPVINLKKSVIK